jgi:beta-N-acetylhexosaminidase
MVPLERPGRRWDTRRLVIVGVAAVVVVALTTALVALLGHHSPAPTSSAAPNPSTAPSPTEPPPVAAAPTGPAPSQAPGPGGSCTALAAGLPLRAQLAQRLMVGVNPQQLDQARQDVATYGVGGVFLSGKPTALLRSDALARMRAATKLPVAVALDEEGGRVQRINQIAGSIPSARVMAKTMTTAQVRTLATTRGRELHALGITVDLAPDADVSDEPDNGAIGDRSFSDDPATVAAYAAAFAAGLRDAGVLPVFKHFPGHGHATGDSHDGSVSTPPLSQLRSDDLVPYRTLLSTGPEAVMVGHLDVPGLTGGTPASLSPAAYSLLRGEYRFTGVTMTDDLGAMKAITDTYDLPHAVLAALRSGADIALWTSSADLSAVLGTLTQAVGDGTLPRADVTASVARILAAKGACTP